MKRIINRIFLIVVLSTFSGLGCTVVDDELLQLVLEIKNQNQELLEEVKSLQAKSDSLINELKNSAAKQEEVLKKVADLQAELAKVLAQIETLNQQLGAQNVDLEEIKSQLADLQEKYQGILEQLEQLQKLSQILAEIEKLKGQLVELDGKYQVIQGSLAENKEQLDALKGLVANLQTQLAENLTKISQLTSQLGEQGADIEKILAAIEELKKSCAEIKTLLENQLSGKSPIPTNGLVAWWPFNGNAIDESGNGNNGQINGATLSSNRFNEQNNSYYFSSSNCSPRIDADVETNSITTAVSISVWFKKNGPGCISPRIFEFWPGRDGPGIVGMGWSQPEKTIYIGFIMSNSTKQTMIVPGGDELINQWINAVYTNDGSKANFYINGDLKISIPVSGNPILATDLAIGRMNHPAFDAFNGNIDDFGIWNRALTSEEVSKIYKGEGF